MGGPAYHVMGRAVAPHQLALGTIGLVLLFAAPNPFGSKSVKTVDYKTDSKEEKKFIQDYVAKHTAETKDH